MEALRADLQWKKRQCPYSHTMRISTQEAFLSYVLIISRMVDHAIVHSMFVLLNTVFTRISAAALIKFFATQMRRLLKGGACLKIGRDKDIFSLNLTVYFLSVRKFYSN